MMMQTSEQHDLSEPPQPDSLPAFHDFLEERQAFEWVLRDPVISRSVIRLRLLGFICQKYCEDKSVEIREHSIAVHALGRRESTFDSQIDPIVRVTARALRKRLREFHETGGKDHALEIVIPLGRYIPQWFRRPQPTIESVLGKPSILTYPEPPQRDGAEEDAIPSTSSRAAPVAVASPLNIRSTKYRGAVWTLL